MGLGPVELKRSVFHTRCRRDGSDISRIAQSHAQARVTACRSTPDFPIRRRPWRRHAG